MVIQLGSILAVVAVFWRRLFGLIGIHFGQKPSRDHATLSLVHVILGMMPAIVVGLAIHSWIKANLFGPQTVMYALVAGGILLIIAEKFRPAVTAETLDDISYKQAFGIGLFQCQWWHADGDQPSRRRRVLLHHGGAHDGGGQRA